MTISRYGGRWLTIPGVQSIHDVSRHQRLARLPVPGRPLPCLPPPGRLPRPPRSPLPPDPARCCRPRQVFRYGCCMGLEREGCGPGSCCCGALMCLSPIHVDIHCVHGCIYAYVQSHAHTDTCLHVLCPVHAQSHIHTQHMHIQCHMHTLSHIHSHTTHTQAQHYNHTHT